MNSKKNNKSNNNDDDDMCDKTDPNSGSESLVPLNQADPYR